MNALTNTTGTAVANVSSADPWATALSVAGGTTGKFLKFDGNTGDFLYGPENDQKELKHGSRAVVDMTSYAQGFICWNDSEVIEELMDKVLVNPAGPNKADLKDHGPYKGKRDGWKQQVAFSFFEGETETLFSFKASSGGGRRGCKTFLESFVKEYRKHPGQFPVVELGAVSFETKDEDGNKAGKKYAPTFKIVAWFSQAEYEVMASAAASDDEEDGAVNPTGGDANDASNYVQEQEQQPETVAEPVVEKKVETPAPAAAAETGRRAKRF